VFPAKRHASQSQATGLSFLPLGVRARQAAVQSELYCGLATGCGPLPAAPAGPEFRRQCRRGRAAAQASRHEPLSNIAQALSKLARLEQPAGGVDDQLRPRSVHLNQLPLHTLKRSATSALSSPASARLGSGLLLGPAGAISSPMNAKKKSVAVQIWPSSCSRGRWRPGAPPGDRSGARP